MPFQYFGVADGTDLSAVTWRRGGYVAEELSNLYSNDDLRVAKLLDAIKRLIGDPTSMRALGFCVSKAHARYMASKFTDAGLASRGTDGRRRPGLPLKGPRRSAGGEAALHLLRGGPGRGGRCPRCRLPLASAPDFVRDSLYSTARPRTSSRGGEELPDRHRSDRPAPARVPLRGSSTGDRRHQARTAFKARWTSDFPFLPAGCSIDLDRKSREIVLDNLKAAANRARWQSLVADLVGRERRCDAARLLGQGRLSPTRASTEADGAGLSCGVRRAGARQSHKTQTWRQTRSERSGG